MQPVKVEPALTEFQGFGPLGRSAKLIRIPYDRLLKHYEMTGNRNMLEEAWFIPDVCRAPTGIWRGLERDGQEQAMCYAGIPTRAIAP